MITSASATKYRQPRQKTAVWAPSTQRHRQLVRRPAIPMPILRHRAQLPHNQQYELGMCQCRNPSIAKGSDNVMLSWTKDFHRSYHQQTISVLDSAEYFPGVAVCTALQNTKLGIQCPDVEEATAFTLSPIDRHFTDFCELQVNKTCIIQLFFPALC